MPVHRIKKASGVASALQGASPQTVGVVFDNSTTEGVLRISVDGVNTRKIEDGHLGAAAETANGTSLVVANQQQSAAGIGNGADTTADTLFTYTLPANALNVAGKGLGITAWGKTAANGNNKTINVKLGGTTILTSGVVTSNNLAWYAYCEVIKVASNSQVILATLQIGTAITVQTVTTATETDTAAIIILVQGQSGTSNMRAPDSFVAALSDMFNDRLRIRWSHKRNEFHIEQQVGRAALPPIHISEADDDLIRARDGYAFVLAVRPGDRMPCPECAATSARSDFRCAEVKCERCKASGKDARYVAGFFPLGDMLLEYLRSIDPSRRDPYDIIRQLDRRNALLERTRTRDASNQIEAATLDNYKRLVGIQSVGYTGKESMWQ
jgi:hypothetical protein